MSAASKILAEIKDKDQRKRIRKIKDSLWLTESMLI